MCLKGKLVILVVPVQWSVPLSSNSPLLYIQLTHNPKKKKRGHASLKVYPSLSRYSSHTYGHRSSLLLSLSFLVFAFGIIGGSCWYVCICMIEWWEPGHTTRFFSISKVFPLPSRLGTCGAPRGMSFSSFLVLCWDLCIIAGCNSLWHCRSYTLSNSCNLCLCRPFKPKLTLISGLKECP